MLVVTKRAPLSDEEAQVGIGTMIIFIASVLVAAVAAGTIITTSSDLQQKSQQTGQEATEQVASTLILQHVIGKRDATTDAGLKDLELYISLGPGATEIDIGQMRIFLQNGTQQHILAYTSGVPVATEYTASAQRDADSSFSATQPVLNTGDLVVIAIDLETVGLEIEPRDTLEIRLNPEVGENVYTAIRTDGSYGVNLILPLN